MKFDIEFEPANTHSTNIQPYFGPPTEAQRFIGMVFIG